MLGLGSGEVLLMLILSSLLAYVDVIFVYVYTH